MILRRRFPGMVALTRSDDGRGDLFRADVEPGTGVWKFAVPAISSLIEDIDGSNILTENRACQGAASGTV